jgi:hypothetical protein
MAMASIGHPQVLKNCLSFFPFLIPIQHLLNILIHIANKKGIKKWKKIENVANFWDVRTTGC